MHNDTIAANHTRTALWGDLQLYIQHCGVNRLLSKYSSLNELKPGQTARVQKLLCTGDLRRRLLDLGLGTPAQIDCVGSSPAGDPKAFLIRGAVIALRDQDSRKVLVERPSVPEKSIALAGNPNVGKSTLFNALTGMKQHTGNWPGKTVEQSQGTFRTALHVCRLIDTPGAYSLAARSPEEEITRDFLCFGGADAAIAVCDASCLERNLNLVLQILELCPRTLVCVNLMDEAEKRHIEIDQKILSQELGVPVVGISAREKQGLYALTEALDKLLCGPGVRPVRPVTYPSPLEAAIQILEPSVQNSIGSLLPARWLSLRLLEDNKNLETALSDYLGYDLKKEPSIRKAYAEAQEILRASDLQGDSLQDAVAGSILSRAEEIAGKAVQSDLREAQKTDRILDWIFTGHLLGYPIMLLLLAGVLWLTITGANYLSGLLSEVLFGFQNVLTGLFLRLQAPDWLHGLLVLGAYRVLAWVVSCMLPPMAIFFPLFTLLEDAGYLPRIAYNLDHVFQRCRSCGKQALTLCMSFGCNAVGVTGCRIIDSPRERMIAILTCSFVPCNGRFPALIALLTMFFGTAAGGSLLTAEESASLNTPGSSLLPALLLTVLVVFSVVMALLFSRLLSCTLLRGLSSSFTLELPPYRKPQIGRVLLRSLLDRTLFVLGRAAAAAAPAGALIWLLASIRIGDASLLSLCSGALQPFASLFGLDGVILLAFLLGLPANEIVIPVMLAAYLEQGVLTEAASAAVLKTLLVSQGWTGVTAVCTLIFMLFHFPCATTLLTIKKETGSLRWTLLAAALPTAVGLALCFITAQGAGLLGIG